VIWVLTYQPSPNRPRMWNESAPTEPRSIRWVTESGMSEAAIIQDYERRHHGTKVLSLVPAGVSVADPVEVTA